MRILLFLVLVFMSGCSTFAPQVEKIEKGIADGVELFCKEIPKSSRQERIENVNAELSGQVILVDCGD